MIKTWKNSTSPVGINLKDVQETVIVNVQPMMTCMSNLRRQVKKKNKQNVEMRGYNVSSTKPS